MKAGRFFISISLTLGGEQVVHAAMCGARPATGGIQYDTPHLTQLTGLHVKGKEVSLQQRHIPSASPPSHPHVTVLIFPGWVETYIVFEACCQRSVASSARCHHLLGQTYA